MSKTEIEISGKWPHQKVKNFRTAHGYRRRSNRWDENHRLFTGAIGVCCDTELSSHNLLCARHKGELQCLII